MCIDHIPYGDCRVYIKGKGKGKGKGEFGRAREKGKKCFFPFFLAHPNSPSLSPFNTRQASY